MSRRRPSTRAEPQDPAVSVEVDAAVGAWMGRSLRARVVPPASSQSSTPGRTPSRAPRRSVRVAGAAESAPSAKENRGEPSPERGGEEGSISGERPGAGETRNTDPAEALPSVPAGDSGSGADGLSEKENLAASEEEDAAAEVGQSIPGSKMKKKKKTDTTSRQEPNRTAVVPLGKPKSGRVWKDRNKQRFSALLRDKPLCSSWERKMEGRREKERVKGLARQLQDDKKREREEKRMRREETLKRRLENERKAEIVQVIRNPAKIKRMKKKQLRRVEKRDTLNLPQRGTPLARGEPKRPRKRGTGGPEQITMQHTTTAPPPPPTTAAQEVA
ncbi:coiled-coil domain-containing protein 86 [Amia ocellicauda]|uniref:coiled-coil domain-containing protein 86 n=1 Tax=Amia ocellicauda TaxID=2972642 RepID=UPI003463C517